MTNLTTKIAHIVGGDLVSKGFGFLLTIYLTRVLGIEGFGMVTVAMAYLGYAVFFADFGLFKIGAREAAKPPTQRDFTPFEVLFTRMVMAFFVFILTWILLPYFISNDQQLILTRRFAIAILIHAYLIEWYFNGIQRFDLLAISKSLQMGIYAFGAFIIVKNQTDILHLPIFYVVGLFVTAIILLAIAFRDNAFMISKRGISVYIALLKSSASIGGGLLFAQVLQLLPPIMIGIFLTTSDAGLYGAAFRLILIGMLIDRLFVQLLIPNLSKQWVENKDRVLTNMDHTSRLMLSIGAIISIFIAIGSSDFAAFLFGDEFRESGPIISALSLFLFFTFQNSIFAHGLLAIGKDFEFFRSATFGGLLVIFLIIFASMYFDTTIVGIAVAVGEMIITLLCFYWFRKSISFKYIVPFISTLSLGLLIFYGSNFIDLWPTLEAIFGSIIIVVLLLLFRILRIADLQWLKSVLLK